MSKKADLLRRYLIKYTKAENKPNDQRYRIVNLINNLFPKKYFISSNFIFDLLFFLRFIQNIPKRINKSVNESTTNDFISNPHIKN